MDQTAPVTPALVPLVRLSPAPWNPRSINDERFQNLCRSIEADPDFLWRRPVLTQADGTIYAGNMRFRAAQHLGLTEIPAIVEELLELAFAEAEEDQVGAVLMQGIDQLRQVVLFPLAPLLVVAKRAFTGKLVGHSHGSLPS